MFTLPLIVQAISRARQKDGIRFGHSCLVMHQTESSCDLIECRGTIVYDKNCKAVNDRVVMHWISIIINF